MFDQDIFIMRQISFYGKSQSVHLKLIFYHNLKDIRNGDEPFEEEFLDVFQC